MNATLEPLAPAFMTLATSQGLSEDQARRLWEKYCTKSAEKGFHPSAKGWDGWVKAEKRFQNGERVRQEAAVRVAAIRSQERARKAAEDEAYAIGAISLPEYLVSLWEKPNRTAAEQKLVEFRKPRPGEDIAAWMIAALSAPPTASGPQLRQDARSHVCACGAPRETWSNLGHVYWASTCPQCGRAAKGEPR